MVYEVVVRVGFGAVTLLVTGNRDYAQMTARALRRRRCVVHVQPRAVVA
jgi:hypothetical protein